MRNGRLFFWRLRYVFWLFWFLKHTCSQSLFDALIMAKAEFYCLGFGDVVNNGVWESAKDSAKGEAEQLWYDAMEEA